MTPNDPYMTFDLTSVEVVTRATLPKAKPTVS